MFHGTTTFLAIFLILNHDLAATRTIEVQTFDRDVRLRKRKASENQSLQPHSRQKRRWGALVRTGLGILAGGTFALSTSSTIYHEIRKCKDYRPTPCKSPTCHYLRPCPSVCQGPSDNRDFALKEKDKITKKLDQMDKIQLDAFNLATNGINAGLDTKRILTEVDRINEKVDQLMFDIVELDLKVAERFRNRSVEIKKLLRNKRLSLGDIIVSPEVQGIFDKWTWEGTGIFVLSIALPVTFKLYSVMKERYAIHKIYKEMKVDFSNRFINQKAATNPNSFNQPKIRNKFAYVQGYTTKDIDAQLKKTARATYYGEQANRKVSRTEKIVNNYLGPLVNAIVTALGVYSIYQHINNCIAIANDMQNTAINITEEHDQVEKIMVEQVRPLPVQVSQQVWEPVKNLLTNETLIDWLDGIRNLTLEAKNPNVTTANSIKNFIDNIPTADVSKTRSLQRTLIGALKNVKFEYSCLADKQHAVTIVVTDCRKGRDDLNTLYADAVSKHNLNRKLCLDNNMVPYTSLAQFKNIVDKYAKNGGWYSNCLLNDNDLLIRVCNEKLKGWTTPAQIKEQVNKTALTEAMISNFLTRCPPPKITPKSRTDTCNLYCLYQPPEKIATSVALLLSQVNGIIKTCAICSVRPEVEAQICSLHFCKEQNSSTIEKTVRLPLPTVDHVIKNKCVQKCVVGDTQKKEICKLFKCQSYTKSRISTELGLPLSTINEVTNQCNTILPSCGAISDVKRRRVLNLHCGVAKLTAMQIYIYNLVDLSLALIQQVIASQTCEDFLKNGLNG